MSEGSLSTASKAKAEHWRLLEELRKDIIDLQELGKQCRIWWEAMWYDFDQLHIVEEQVNQFRERVREARELVDMEDGEVGGAQSIFGCSAWLFQNVWK